MTSSYFSVFSLSNVYPFLASLQLVYSLQDVIVDIEKKILLLWFCERSRLILSGCLVSASSHISSVHFAPPSQMRHYGLGWEDGGVRGYMSIGKNKKVLPPLNLILTHVHLSRWDIAIYGDEMKGQRGMYVHLVSLSFRKNSSLHNYSSAENCVSFAQKTSSQTTNG